MNGSTDFGWELPPGVTNKMIDALCGPDEPELSDSQNRRIDFINDLMKLMKKYSVDHFNVENDHIQVMFINPTDNVILGADEIRIEDLEESIREVEAESP